jgi:hypothetical protein
MGVYSKRQFTNILVLLETLIISVHNYNGSIILHDNLQDFMIGFASFQVPLYIAELSPRTIRGRLVGMFQWSVTLGHHDNVLHWLWLLLHQWHCLIQNRLGYPVARHAFIFGIFDSVGSLAGQS